MRVRSQHYDAVKKAVKKLSRIIDEEEPSEIDFIRACAQSTDKQTSRIIRHERIKKEIVSGIQES